MLATMVLKELGVQKVIAKAVTALHGRFLEKIGADEVVYPEIDSGRRLGRKMARPNIVEQLDFGSEHGVFEIKVPKKWVGKTLGDLDVRVKYGLTVLVVKGDQEEDMNVSPLASTEFVETDMLLVLGSQEDIQKLAK
jgi:trk system potassium uptake protein TrkA